MLSIIGPTGPTSDLLALARTKDIKAFFGFWKE